MLEHEEPDRSLYLAISEDAYVSIFSEPEGRELIVAQSLKILVFDPIGSIAEELVQAGIPREHIVLAFHHPAKRKQLPFAVS